MRYLHLLIFISIISLNACNVLDKDKSEAIKLVQTSQISFENENYWTLLGLVGIGINKDMTYLQMANRLAKESPNKKLVWTAEKTDEAGVYLVSFIDESGWGHRWQVAVDQKIVKHINQNDYLSRLYGFSRLDKSNEFQISEFLVSEIKTKNTRNKGKQIIYQMKGILVNKTDKIITDAKINGELKLIFKDKTVIGSSKDDFIDMYSSFWNEGNTTNLKLKVTNNKPWRPGETREFQFMTDGIDDIYLNYIPEYVVLEINLEAEDPTGYNYNKNIEEIDLMEKWKTFIAAKKSNSDEQSNHPKQTINSGEVAIESAKINETNPEMKLSDSEKVKNANSSQTKKIEYPKPDPRALYPGKKSSINKVGSDAENVISNQNEKLDNFLSFELRDRMIIKKPVISDQTQEFGKVVIEVVVDENGNVIEASGPAKGSTTSSPILVAKSKQAAFDTKYEVSPHGLQEQKGTMTFIFSFK